MRLALALGEMVVVEVDEDSDRVQVGGCFMIGYEFCGGGLHA